MKIIESKLDITKCEYDADVMWTLPDGTQLTGERKTCQHVYLNGNQPVISSVTIECTSFEDLMRIIPYRDVLEEIYMNLGVRKLEALANNSDIQTLYNVFELAWNWDSPQVEVCAKRLCYLLDLDFGVFEDYDSLEKEFERILRNSMSRMQL